MLVLNRKSGEKVLVGEDIEVVVLGVQGDRVKLGFTAPRYVPIFRAEIHELANSAVKMDEGELAAVDGRQELLFS